MAEDVQWRRAVALARAAVEVGCDLTMKRHRQILVLVDMNGTLLVRSKQRLAGREPDVSSSGMHYYVREHADALMEWLRNQRYVVMAFYTSMRMSSAQPAVDLLCRGATIFDREFNQHDPSGDNPWDTMRDLNKVWQHVDGFDDTNTIVIEDTMRKMRDHPRNVVVVPSYTETTVLGGGDDALVGLPAYIHGLITADDVRQTIAANRYWSNSVVVASGDSNVATPRPHYVRKVTTPASRSKRPPQKKRREHSLPEGVHEPSPL